MKIFIKSSNKQSKLENEGDKHLFALGKDRFKKLHFLKLILKHKSNIKKHLRNY